MSGTLFRVCAASNSVSVPHSVLTLFSGSEVYSGIGGTSGSLSGFVSNMVSGLLGSTAWAGGADGCPPITRFLTGYVSSSCTLPQREGMTGCGLLDNNRKCV